MTDHLEPEQFVSKPFYTIEICTRRSLKEEGQGAGGILKGYGIKNGGHAFNEPSNKAL